MTTYKSSLEKGLFELNCDKTKKYMCYVETSNKKVMKSRDPFLSSNFPF